MAVAAVAQIVHFGIEPSLDTHATGTKVDDKVKKAAKALKGLRTTQHFVLGTLVQDKGAIQITSEWTDVQDSMNLESRPEVGTFIENVNTSCGDTQSLFHVSPDRPVFGPDGPATANVVEYVQVYFPASRVTPEFQKKIEGDFSRFEELFRRAAKGDLGLAVGWVLEEQEHEGIKGENAKCFFVMRGWESMDYFEQSVKHDAYKEVVPILFAWDAPFKMWHVERKVAADFEAVV